MKEKDNKKDFIDHVKERCIEATNMTEEKAHEFAMLCWKLGFTDSDANQFLIDENYKLYNRTKLLEIEVLELEKDIKTQTETIDTLVDRGKTLQTGVELYEGALEKACEHLANLEVLVTGKDIKTKNNWKQYFINEVVRGNIGGEKND